jgi:acyl-homoserine lactone acylase PvdQ
MRWRWIAGITAGLALVAVGWPIVRAAMGPSVPPPSEAARQHAQNVRILRDRFGVAHVFGASDADAAFGMAWAHAEDDFPMIQGVLAASRGQLGLHKPGMRSLANDYYARFVGVDAEVEEHWPNLDPHVQGVFEAYAEGLNYWAHHHPEEADARLMPFEGKDVARGFVHKLPLMMGIDTVLARLGEDSPDVGEALFPERTTGSNSQAVGPKRSADGIVRLNVNSHQPWEGPVSWYEIHVHSDEGWDAVGGTFPGAPMILHGHNRDVAWAMTVNHPDVVDVYALEIDEDRSEAGAFAWTGPEDAADGAEDGFAPLTSTDIWLPLETPWATLQIPQTVRHSVHGPVFERGERPYALHWSAKGQGVYAAQQWFELNKATDAASFQAAMSRNAIPMFNIVYADSKHIGMVYNARIPARTPIAEIPGAKEAGLTYLDVLPGDVPEWLWDDVWPYLSLPQVTDPPSGFVQACNSTPWIATVGPGTPRRHRFASEAGIETTRTNRGLRTLERWGPQPGGAYAPIGRAAFLDLKWDRQLAASSAMQRRLLDPLADENFPEWGPEASDPDHEPVTWARQALLDWNGRFDEESIGAAVAVLAFRPLNATGDDVESDWDVRVGLRRAVEHLEAHFERRDVALGELQRLRRGDVDLPVGGGPDILNATYTEEAPDGVLVGDQGDSYVMIVELPAPDEVRSQSIHNYGASNRKDSPHYADQAPLFVARKLKPVLMDEADIRRFLDAEYRPGEAWTPTPIDPEDALAEARTLGLL